MSTYITSVEPLVLDAWMRAEDVIDIDENETLAESNFIGSIRKDAVKALKDTSNQEKRVKLKNFWWTGTGSALEFEETLLKKIAPKIMGRVEVIFTWEGGEWQTGLIIEDGKVTECDVVQKLVPKKK